VFPYMARMKREASLGARGVSPGLRRGGGGSARSSAHGSASFGGSRGGARALEGGCGPRPLGPCPLGPRPLFRPRSLRPFNGRRRRNRTRGRRRGWRLGGVAEVEEDVYGHHHEKRTKHSDRRVEDVEEPHRFRLPPSMGDSYCASSPLAVAGCATGSTRPLRHPFSLRGELRSLY
jgi:hypothetical protein